MKVGDALLCRDSRRRARLRRENASLPGANLWNGLDHVEYETGSGGTSSVVVFLLCGVRDDLFQDDFELQRAGGREKISIRELERLGPSCVRLVPAKSLCPPSTYRLRMLSTGPSKLNIDPQFSLQEFTATDDVVELDPRPAPRCPPKPSAEPKINYLARDYASIRQMLLDRLALTMPQWKERHVPDLGLTLVELLAFVGDYLAYYQDSVGTEAYLNTARQRISVRRHARLVDYPVNEGCNARTFVHVAVDGDTKLDPEDAFFITAHPEAQFQSQAVLHAATLEHALPGSYQPFEPQRICPPSGGVELYAAHNEIAFYTWNQHECCLPVGTTRATLVDPSPPDAGTGDLANASSVFDFQPQPAAEATRAARCYQPPSAPAEAGLPCCPPELSSPWSLRLAPGSVLIFEEVFGPKTHLAADADPQHRWAVRLTRVTPCVDPVTKQRLVDVEWAADDALRFPICVSSVGPAELGCQRNDRVSVARGNMVLVDHGQMIDEPEWLGEVHYVQPLATCDADDALLPEAVGPARGELLRPVLRESDLTFAAPIDRTKSARKIFDQKPDDAVPALTVYGFPIADEPADAYRLADVPPPTLVTFDDLKDPLILLVRYHTYSIGEQRRLEALLPPTSARFLDQFRTADEMKRLVPKLKTPPESLQPHLACPAEAPKPAATTPAPSEEFKVYQAFVENLEAAIRWTAKPHLLDSAPDDRHVVVEIDNERRCHLRFGDGQLGMLPPDATSFYVKYRRGNGPAGNIGAEAIRHLVYRHQQPAAVTAVRNPKPARGGTEYETLDHARLFAPRTFRDQLQRAITADDYSQIVREEFSDRVQQVRATLHRTSIGYDVAVAIDPLADEPNPGELIADVERFLQRRRRIGHVVRASLPTYVGLHLALTVCVADGYLRAHVRRELLDRFSNRRRDDGTPGFFHPDNFGFGDELYVSRVVQAARQVPGVDNVVLTRFERSAAGDQGELEAGILRFGPLEIPRLDNDPQRPERGCLCLDLRGAS